MKNEKLVNAIGMIDDRYIEEAHDKKRKKIQLNLPWNVLGKVAAAACALLLVINIFPVIFHSYSGGAKESYDQAKPAGANGSYYSYSSDSAAFDGNYLEEPAEYMAADEEAYYAAEAEAPSYSQDKPQAQTQEELRQNKKLILTSYMTLETQDLDGLMESLLPTIERYGGYVQRSSSGNRGSTRYYDASIRIPAERYNEFLQEIKGSGNAVYYSEETKDITDSYTDIQARLSSLKAQEAKVLEFYDRAEDLEDLMTVEARLSEIRYQIEYLEAQIKNYDLLVAYSTLNLTVNETQVYTPVTTSFFARLGRAFSNGFRSFLNGIEDFLIDVVYNIWTILFLVILGFAGYKLWKFIRNRRNK